MKKKKTYRTLHLRERNKLATQWVHLVSCHLLHVHYVMLPQLWVSMFKLLLGIS